MSTAVVKLTKGGRTLDLMRGRYNVGTDFQPPATAVSVGFAEGGSHNITGGAAVYTRKYINRSFTFQVRINTTSDLSVRGALQALTALLGEAGDEDEPLYLEYKPNSDTPEPLWGQTGANYRYEIVDARVGGLWEQYGQATLRARTVFMTVECSIKPFALGQTQLLATATGGVLEDVIGSADGRSKGLCVPEATTNWFTNPVFSSSNWSDGWSVCSGATVEAASTIDPAFILPGTRTSVRLTSSGSTGNQYTQQITASNTNTHTISAYAKLNDGSAVTASQCGLWYAGALTTEYRAIGDGWYRLTASRAGIASACAAGVQVVKNQGVTVTGFQLEQKAYATPLAYGDLLGCAWASSPHNSTTTRTAASVKIPVDVTTFNAVQGSARFVVRFDVPNTHPNSMFLFDATDGSHLAAPYLYYEAANDKIALVISGVSAQSSALTFAAGTTYVIHATWGPGGIALYLNGLQVATGAFTYAKPAAQVVLGSYYTGTTLQLVGAIASAAFFDQALTVDQVAADYANLAPLVADGQRVESVPWFWTTSGDNVLSLDTGKQPRGVAGGVPGDAPAMTELQGTLSSQWSSIGSLVLSNFDSPVHVPWSNFFADQSGTALAIDYGGQHKTTVISTSLLKQSIKDSLTTASLPDYLTSLLDDREVYLFERIRTASTVTSGCPVLLSAAYLFADSVCTLYSNERTVTLSASYRLLRTPSFKLPKSARFTGTNKGNLSFTPIAAPPTATAVTVDLDYYAVLPRPALILQSVRGQTRFAYKNATAYVRHSTINVLSDPMTVQGDVLEFEPGKYNALQALFCADETVDPVTTYQLTLTNIYVTPRYRLL